MLFLSRNPGLTSPTRLRPFRLRAMPTFFARRPAFPLRFAARSTMIAAPVQKPGAGRPALPIAPAVTPGF